MGPKASQRKAKVERKTSEVKVTVSLNVDGSGKFDIDTGVPFFTHMLSQFAKHGFFDLQIRAIGDIEVDYHHTVEDVGLALGECFDKALQDKKGITRYGHSIVPFDDALVIAAVDLSGRPYFDFSVEMEKSKVGTFDSELCEEFFKSLTSALRCNIFIELRRGTNTHHIIEAVFKAVTRALDQASTVDPRSRGVPSTKGKL